MEPIRWAATLGAHWRQIVHLRSATQPWLHSVSAALAVGLPLAIAVISGHRALGGLGALGAFVIMHRQGGAPDRPLRVMLGCALAIATSLVLGQFTQRWEVAALPLFGVLITAIVATTRLVRLPPPADTFFVLAASIGAAAGFHPSMLPAMLIVPLAGSLAAIAIMVVVDALLARSRPPTAVPSAVPTDPEVPIAFGPILVDALLFGTFASLALGVALLLNLERPYWVPISCVAVMRGLTLQAVWTRHLQRVLGTVAGIAVTFVVLSIHPEPLTTVLLVALLVLGFHQTTAQNYALTVLFTTPLSLLVTELASLDAVPDTGLLLARIQDIAIGAVIGVAGGLCLHRRPKSWA